MLSLLCWVWSLNVFYFVIPFSAIGWFALTLPPYDIVAGTAFDVGECVGIDAKGGGKAWFDCTCDVSCSTLAW